MANIILKIIERCSDISFLSSLKILVGMLFGPANFLGLKFEIMLFFSSLVQSEIKNKSWLSGGKYFKNAFYENGTSDRTSAATNLFAIVCRLVTVWSPRLIIFGESCVFFWRKIMDLIPFHVFSCYSFYL